MNISFYVAYKVLALEKDKRQKQKRRGQCGQRQKRQRQCGQTNQDICYKYKCDKQNMLIGTKGTIVPTRIYHDRKCFVSFRKRTNSMEFLRSCHEFNLFLLAILSILAFHHLSRSLSQMSSLPTPSIKF